MGGPKEVETDVVDWECEGLHGEVQNENRVLKSFTEMHKGVE